MASDVFEIRENDTFTWMVKVKIPAANNKHEVKKIEATFNVLPQSDVDTLVTNPETRDPVAFLQKALVSVNKALTVRDVEGNALEDDEDRNAVILTKSTFLGPLIDAYAEGIMGYKAKNW